MTASTILGQPQLATKAGAESERRPDAGERSSAGAAAGYAVRQWKALGTYVFLIVAEQDLGDAAADLARRHLARVDRTCSRFRDDSDLNRANASAGRWVDVDPLLIDAVETALSAAEQTEGLVDPSLGLDLRALGYDADLSVVQARTTSHSRALPTDPSALPPAPLLRGGWRELGVDRIGKRIRVPQGCALDLGATAKAFAADRIATALAAELEVGCLISLGGDVAIGVARDGEHPWQVAVSERPGEAAAQTLRLAAGGVATSTVVHRTWRSGGQLRHHLLDPYTGEPAQTPWRTATVIAATCTAANTASTASLVLGERAPQWLDERNVAARLVGTHGEVLTLGDWPAPEAVQH